MILLRQAFCRCSLQRSFSTTAVNLSGHNKWSKIKQKKGVMDAQKSKIYARAARDIMIATRTGGSADPDKNSSLAAALRNARSEGVPKVNIENALKKAAGEKGKGSQLATFEAMAYGSVGVIIESLTDNHNRTLHKMRELLNEHSARFAPVGFLFERKGLVRAAVDKDSENDVEGKVDKVIETALQTSIEDFTTSEDTEKSVEIDFICAPQDLATVTAAINSEGICQLRASELIYVPVEKSVEVEEGLEGKVAGLIESLEESGEDVLRVYTSLD